MKLPLDSREELFPVFPIAEWNDGAEFRQGHRIAMAGLKLDKVRNLKGTTYGNWALAHPAKKAECGDYTWSETVLAPDGDLMVIWSPPIWTAAELETLSTSARAKGKLLDRYHISRQHFWPAVLQSLQLEDSPTKGLNNRRIYQEDVSVSCAVEVSVYVTDVAPTEERVQCEEPIPGEIHGTLNGEPVDFPSCLHGRVTVTSIAPSDATIIDCMPDRQNPPPGDTLVFHATNFEDLEEHVFMMEVVKNRDLYFITEYKVIPPEDIPEIEA